MVRIGRLVIIDRMTGRTIGRGALVTRSVAIDAIQSGVSSRKWECRAVVVKNQICIPRRVASQTCRAVVRITIYAIMLVVGFGIRVAGGAREYGIIGGIRVAVDTLCPFSFVLPAVDGEILPIVVKGGRHPGIFIMAGCTIHRKLQSSVIGVGCVVIIFSVTAFACVRCTIVVSVVTCCAIVGNGGMRTIQGITAIVFRKSGRAPTRFSGMARDTIGRKSQRIMVRVGGQIELR